MRLILASALLLAVGALPVRAQAPLAEQLDTLEEELFAAAWYREVDETVVVNPNRSPAPAFYFR